MTELKNKEESKEHAVNLEILHITSKNIRKEEKSNSEAAKPQSKDSSAVDFIAKHKLVLSPPNETQDWKNAYLDVA